VPDWAAFAAVAVAVTVLVVLLARATQSALDDTTASGGDSDIDEIEEPVTRTSSSLDAVSTHVLLLNVAATQTVFLVVLLGSVWYANIPPETLGIRIPSLTDLGIGVAVGVVLFGLNQLAARAGRQFGLGGDEALRAALTPETTDGWLALLLVVLPVVAGFEELLFRGALVGGFAAGFGLSTLPLLVASSAAFGLAHGVQGSVGVVVTGLLGVALGAVFVATGSLAVVVVAHYLVNALEFVVCEGVLHSDE
jgi:membrane protease YdiL (CAAX protease family)